MHKNYYRIFVAFLVAIGLVCMPGFSSPASADPKPEITIHNIIDLTGAYAPISIPSEKGGKDYLDWIADQGGLDVTKDGKGDVIVNYEWAEFGNVSARFMSSYKRFRRANPIIIEMWSSPDQEMLKPIVARDKIPMYGLGMSDPQLYPPAWNYMDYSSYGEGAAGAIEYYVDHLWDGRGEGRKAKVGHITWDTAYGRASIEPTERHGEATGKYEVVASRFCSSLPNEPEIMAILSDFERRGVDVIWSNTIVQTPAVIQDVLHKTGLKDKMTLIGNLWAPADQLIDVIGPTAAEGYMCAQPVFIPGVDDDSAGVKFARMLNDTYRQEAGLPNIQYMRGVRMKANILEAVRLTLVGIMERDGVTLAQACDRITGTDVKEFGLQQLAGYTAEGTVPEFNTAPAGKDDRRLANHDRLIGIKDGKLAAMSPWYQTPRLIPDEMFDEGYFEDEKPINISIIVREE